MRLNFPHISYERLVDWVEGRLVNTQKTAIDEHLAVCAHCREEATQIERMIAVMRQDESVDAPSTLIARAVALFRASAAKSAPSLLQRLVATLSFESTALTPAFGLRSQGGAERQMIFTANEYDIDLRVSEDSAGWVLSGQLLGAETTSGSATLTNDAMTLTTPLSEELTFVFPPVGTGHYTLTLHFNQIELVIEDVLVGHE
ncbi:MAG: anti-sigma factor family protein [Caldilinea sp.]